jgi:hypothetical protein
MQTQAEQGTLKQPEVTPYEIEKGALMEAMCKWDLGISFLRWLCRLTKWELPMMSTEDAAIRDIWVHMRMYIPAESLAKIETEHIKQKQQLFRELFEVKKEEKDDNGDGGT